MPARFLLEGPENPISNDTRHTIWTYHRRCTLLPEHGQQHRTDTCPQALSTPLGPARHVCHLRWEKSVQWPHIYIDAASMSQSAAFTISFFSTSDQSAVAPAIACTALSRPLSPVYCPSSSYSRQIARLRLVTRYHTQASSSPTCDTPQTQR